MYTTSLFSTVLQLITDIYLEFKHNFYWYFSPGVDYITLWVVFWIYPSVNIIFLNFYPTNKKFSTSVYYILGWTLFALVYEWFAVNSSLFQYNGWKLWYSALIYPFLYLLLYINWKIIRRLYRLSL
ncbi:CBO0543 family protein [Metabacillus halosaccharovorans]|uniref:CBO0543 family protein n=1 Tax=Metabacillus halosaccharovorans TaxID=930124 RepID=UPI003CCC26CD